MIPKIIHYCWFGKNELSLSQKLLIEEWKSVNPDYNFIKWDESNIPLDLDYTLKAQEEKKWANLSNFARLHALTKFGGIYIDTDFKIIKNLDKFLNNRCFLGFETNENDKNYIVNNAFIGAVPNHEFIVECYYTLLNKFDGTEKANESSPILTTEVLKKKYNIQSSHTVNLEDITIYNKKYFYPIHWSETFKLDKFEEHIFPETVAIHLWSKSWLTHEMLINELNTWQKWAFDLSKRNEELSLKLNTEESIHSEESETRKSIDIHKTESLLEMYSAALSEKWAETMKKVVNIENTILSSNQLHINKFVSIGNEIEDLKKIISFRTEKYNQEFEQLRKNQEVLHDKTLNKVIENNKDTNNTLSIININLKEIIDNVKDSLHFFEERINQASKLNSESIMKKIEENNKQRFQNNFELKKEIQKIFLTYAQEFKSELKNIYTTKEKEIGSLRLDLSFQTKATSILSVEIEKTNSTLSALISQFETEKQTSAQYISELKSELMKKNKEIELLKINQTTSISTRLKQLIKSKK